jgi:hypothetical protein
MNHYPMRLGYVRIVNAGKAMAFFWKVQYTNKMHLQSQQFYCMRTGCRNKLYTARSVPFTLQVVFVMILHVAIDHSIAATCHTTRRCHLVAAL